jgi:hypothetical protein
LTSGDWEKLKANLTAKHVRRSIGPANQLDDGDELADEFTAGRFEAINAVLLDMLAAVRRALG